MKRQLLFNINENAYVILENDSIVFEIGFQDLRFDSRAFYNGIYADGKSANIELINSVSPTQSPKAAYVYRWLNAIINDIKTALGEEDVPAETDDAKETKTITLYDMAVCAGVGDFMSVDESSGESMESSLLNADFALRISGHSMEPTLEDGSIVYVEEIEEPADGQIIVVNVDGSSMVKRYRITDGRAFLVPDNESGEYETIEINEEKNIKVQGRVIPIETC